MMKRIKCLLLLCLACSLTACGFFKNHRLDVQQGNIIDQKLASRVHNGMSKKQVLYVLGSPVKETTFAKNRWEYVYTLKKGYKPMKINKLVIVFANGRVTHIEDHILDDAKFS